MELRSGSVAWFALAASRAVPSQAAAWTAGFAEGAEPIAVDSIVLAAAAVAVSAVLPATASAAASVSALASVVVATAAVATAAVAIAAIAAAAAVAVAAAALQPASVATASQLAKDNSRWSSPAKPLWQRCSPGEPPPPAPLGQLLLHSLLMLSSVHRKLLEVPASWHVQIRFFSAGVIYPLRLGMLQRFLIHPVEPHHSRSSQQKERQLDSLVPLVGWRQIEDAAMKAVGPAASIHRSG